MDLWKIDGNNVIRGSRVIATISETPSGNWKWEGMGMYRENFIMKQWILEDVKWFHRYLSRRKRQLIFESGRKIAI